MTSRRATRPLLLVGPPRTVVGRAELAAGLWRRLLGWVGRAPEPGEPALWLAGAGAVHTLGLRGPIDVVFLDAHGRVLRVRRRLRPARIAIGPSGTRHTLELAPGDAARLGLTPGLRIGLGHEPAS